MVFRRVVPVLSGFALLAVLWVVVISPGSPVRQRDLRVENFAEVDPGMRLAQVEDLLGGPAGNYGRFSDAGATMTREGFFCPPGSRDFEPPRGLVWTTDDRRFEICFDENMQVVVTHERAGYEQGAALGSRMRRLFGL